MGECRALGCGQFTKLSLSNQVGCVSSLGGCEVTVGLQKEPELLDVAAFQKRSGRIDVKRVVRAALMGSLAAAILMLVRLVVAAAAASRGSITSGIVYVSMAAAEAVPKEAGLAGSIGTGLAAGFLHTLAGPDHLAALAPLSIGRSRGVSMALGALWGGGHTTGQMLVGALFVIFKEKISEYLPLLSRYGTVAVGLTLIAIGLMGWLETQDMAGDEVGEEEVSANAETGADDGGKRRRWFATYATGIVYGFHPDAVMLILPALALSSRLTTGLYVLSFALGTIVAMSGYTGLIGASTEVLGRRVPKINRWLSIAAAIFAGVIGVALLGAGIMGVEMGL